MTEKQPEEIMRQVLELEKELQTIKSRAERPIPVVRDRQGRLAKDLTLKEWLQKLNEEVDELKEVCFEGYTFDSNPATAKVILSPFFKERLAEEMCDVIKVLYSMAAQMGIDGDDLDEAMHKCNEKTRIRGCHE